MSQKAHRSLGSNSGYLKIEKDVSAFRYEAQHNRRIQQVAILRVFRKAGPYIFNLGLVNFFEFFTVNLLLVVKCYYDELQELEEIKHSSHPHRSLNFLASNVSTRSLTLSGLPDPGVRL